MSTESNLKAIVDNEDLDPNIDQTFGYVVLERADGNQSSSGMSFTSHVCLCLKTSFSCSQEYPHPLKMELLFCTVYAIIAQIKHIIPINAAQRPIPYMITANSQDVIINLTLNHEFVAPEMETVPDYLLVIVGIILPILAMATTGLVLGYRRNSTSPSSALMSTLLDIHSATCMYMVAFGSTAFFTNFLKYYVGYLRPNFYTMCEYDSDTMACTADEEYIRESRKSFPSGHSSIAFCGMMCLGLYLAGKVGLHHGLQQMLLTQRSLHDPDAILGVKSYPGHIAQGATRQPLWKKFGFLFALGGPIFLATFIAASRVHDNWHHPADVVAGSLIGTTCAYVAHLLW